jgi:hypothetical protein
MNLKTTSILIAFLCAPLILIAQQSTKRLASGFYNLTNDPGIKLKLEGTNEFYNVDQTIIVSAQHITSTIAKTIPGNGKTISVLQIMLDAKGMKALNESLDKGVVGKHNIGLIINNKLRTAGWFFGPIQGLSMNISFGDKYTLEQLQALKVEVDRPISFYENYKYANEYSILYIRTAVCLAHWQYSLLKGRI